MIPELQVGKTFFLWINSHRKGEPSPDYVDGFMTKKDMGEFIVGFALETKFGNYCVYKTYDDPDIKKWIRLCQHDVRWIPRKK